MFNRIFFKAVKSTFSFENEFHVNSFDPLIVYTAIVYVRYVVVSWKIRKNNDVKILRKIFLKMCEEIADKTFIEEINVLLSLIDELSKVYSSAV